MARGTIISRTTKAGKKRYYTAIWTQTPDGKRKQVWKTFDLKKQAEDYLDRHSHEIRQGEYFEPPNITFNEFAAEWLRKYSQKEGLKDSTIKSYHLIIERHLKPFFGHMLVHRIRVATIEKDFRPMLSEKITVKTKMNILMVLRAMFNTALTWGYTRSNPFDSRNRHFVAMPEYVREEKGRALTPDEIKSLLEECLDDAYPIVRTAIFTGMRESELFGLKWSDIDFEARQIHVQRAVYWRRGAFFGEQAGFTFTKPKSETSDRKIDFGPDIKRVLLEHKIHSTPNKLDLVFSTSSGQPYSCESFVKIRFKAAVTAAKLGKLRFHDLRHTFGSLKISQGENLKYVQTQMGHSSIQVTLDVYTKLLEKSNEQAALKTEDLVFSNKLVEPKV